MHGSEKAPLLPKAQKWATPEKTGLHLLRGLQVEPAPVGWGAPANLAAKTFAHFLLKSVKLLRAIAMVHRV